MLEASSGKYGEFKYLRNFMTTLYEKMDSNVKRPFVLRKLLFEFLKKRKNAFLCKLLALMKFPTPEDPQTQILYSKCG